MENDSENPVLEVIFLSGQGNYLLSKNILEKLVEIIGQRFKFDYIDFNKFNDGELDNRLSAPYSKYRGATVVFFQSLSTQEYVTEALDLIWPLKHQYGASRVIGIFPFMWCRRQDPKMEIDPNDINPKEAKPDEIQRLRQTIWTFAMFGVDEMLVATPHSNEMEILCTEHGMIFHEIDPSPIFADMIKTLATEDREMCVYSPDWGSVGRAINVASILKCPVLFSLKNRMFGDETLIVSADKEDIDKRIAYLKDKYKFSEIYYAIPQMVKGKTVIMVEDEVATGNTANSTARLLTSFGTYAFFLLVTHPVLTLGWKNKLFYKNPFKKVIMADTIFRGYEKRTGGRIINVTLAGLFASKLFKIMTRLEIIKKND